MRTFWLLDRVGVDPQTVLANPSLLLLIAPGLRIFYRPLLRAWSALHGSWSQAGLVASTADSLTGRPAVWLRPVYGYLNWDCTWKTVFHAFGQKTH